MFLLDTMIISELRKKDRANRNVIAWADSIRSSEMYLSVITVMEIELGALLINRRDPLQGAILRSWIDEKILPAFKGRIIPVDLDVARKCAALHVPNQRAERDALIAATAMVHKLKVATRNIADFEPTRVKTVNPWDFETATADSLRKK